MKRRKEQVSVAKIKKEQVKPELLVKNGLNSKTINSEIQDEEAVGREEKGKELNRKTVAPKCKEESDTSGNPPKKIKVEDPPKKMAFTFDDEGLPIWEEKEFPWDRIPPRPHGWDQHLWDAKCLRTFSEMRKAQYDALIASCQRKLESKRKQEREEQERIEKQKILDAADEEKRRQEEKRKKVRQMEEEGEKYMWDIFEMEWSKMGCTMADDEQENGDGETDNNNENEKTDEIGDGQSTPKGISDPNYLLENFKKDPDDPFDDDAPLQIGQPESNNNFQFFDDQGNLIVAVGKMQNSGIITFGRNLGKKSGSNT